MISNKIRQTTEELSTRAFFDQDTRNVPAQVFLCHNRRSRGFTLIELLVVLGIITAVVAGVGLALRGGDETVAVSSAQRTMSSLLTATRAQAIMNGTNARLIVNIDRNDPDRYLRFAGIIRREEIGGTTGWVPTSEGTSFPRGAYFVPQWTEDRPADLFDGWTENTDAFSNYQGVMPTLTYPRRDGLDFLSESTGHRWAYYEFGPNGELTGGTNLQIVVTAGRRTAGTPVLENPENVRGAVIRRIGTFHLVNERLSFHETN